MEVRVNTALLRGYMDALTKVRDEFGLTDDMSLMGLCRMPEVLSTERRELDADELTAGCSASSSRPSPGTTPCASGKGRSCATTCSPASRR